jgi:hypothetical protein
MIWCFVVIDIAALNAPDVQVRGERIASFTLLALPAKALLDLKTARIDVLALEKLYVFLREVLSYYSHEPHIGEITGRSGKIGG